MSHVSLARGDEASDGPTELVLDDGSAIHFVPNTEQMSVMVGAGRMPTWGEHFRAIETSANSFWSERIGNVIAEERRRKVMLRTTKRIVTALRVMGALIALSPQALAQEEEVTEDDGSDSAQQDGSPDTDAKVDEVGNTKADGDAFEGRFRWGISALGGPLVGGATGGLVGVDLRFGGQISEFVGIYGQPVALIGGGTSRVSGPCAGCALLLGGGALVDFTFIDDFYVAAGPEFLFGGVGSATGPSSGLSGSGESGAFFSVATRAGVVLGSKSPEKRCGMQLGLDMRIVFTSAAFVAPLVSLGYEFF